MSDSLVFPDAESVADLATFVGRARALDEEGAIRLQVVGDVLAAWVCVLPGKGLMREGLTLGLRTMRLAGSATLDVTVPLGGLTDRFARRASTGDVSTSVDVPPTEVAPAWAAVSPPRGGWEPLGLLAVDDLAAAAEQGIAEVAQGAPEGSGAAAVADLRARVWGRHLAQGVPAGVALAVHALGFAPGRGPASSARADPEETVAMYRSGPWVRLACPVGHVLARS